MKLTINSVGLAKALNLKVGAVVDVECKGGVPISREWRNRLKDSIIDNCVSITKPAKKTKEDK